jgi:hypothetical protein
MKSYKNTEFGFEIEIPDHWPDPMKVAADGLMFNCFPVEAMNFMIAPILPERLLEYTEFEFAQYVQREKHTNLEFGRISVGEKEHLWARYCMVNGMWAKIYLIVFGRVEYTITASCADRRTFVEIESSWDTIVSRFD